MEIVCFYRVLCLLLNFTFTTCRCLFLPELGSSFLLDLMSDTMCVRAAVCLITGRALGGASYGYDIMISELKNLSKCKVHTSLFWNCRSLLNKIEEIDRIKIEASSEIIGVCETWLTSQIDNQMVEIYGYNIFRFD